jgi:hypothetical protein
MKLTRRQAEQIALDAAESAGYNIGDSTGYYQIWEREDGEIDYAVEITKERFDGKGRYDGKEYFTIYISPSNDDGYWEHTSSLDTNELVDKLMEIVSAIDVQEQVELERDFSEISQK